MKVYLVKDEKFSDAWGDKPYEVDWCGIKIFDTEDKAIDYILAFLKNVVKNGGSNWQLGLSECIDEVPTKETIKEDGYVRYEWRMAYSDEDYCEISYEEYEME